MATWRRKETIDSARYGWGVQATFEYDDNADTIAIKRETLEALLVAAGFEKEGRALKVAGHELTEVAADACGRQHPNKPGVICTLPAGHGPVLVGTIQFSHFDLSQELAWIET